MAKNPAGEQFEMSFFDHLEELRLRIGLAVLGIVIGCIVMAHEHVKQKIECSAKSQLYQ